MAIRPTDLSLAYVQGAQSQPVAQRAEESPRVAQAAAQAAFVAETEQRNETVAETGDMQGNRIEVKDREQDAQDQQSGRRRRRQPGTPFEESTVDPITAGDPPHLIDFTA